MERKQLALIESIWENLDEHARRALDYIRKEIASGLRTPEDVEFLRETRLRHIGRYRDQAC